MGLSDVCVVFLSLTLLLNASSVYSNQENEQKKAQDSKELVVDCIFLSGKLREVLYEQVREYENNPFPGLPPIQINIGESVDITTSLANIILQGLTDITVTCPIEVLPTRPHLQVTFDKTSLFVGNYASTGHILNLPFNGEGPMFMRLHKLEFDFSFEMSIFGKQCAKYNTTNYDLRLERMEIKLENMNPNEAPDLGQLINIVIPTVAQDVVDQFEKLLFTNHYYAVDKTIITLINMFLKCNDVKSVGEIITSEELAVILKDTYERLIDSIGV